MNGLIYFKIITLLTNVFNCVYWVFISVNIVLDMTIAISYCLLVETELIYVV